ncbi:hypothetical protein H257_18365, partial [Aphanomyces astaci]
REDTSLSAPWRTRSGLPDGDSYMLSKSGNRHALPQCLCGLLLHQGLKQMALVPFPANNDPSGVRDDMDMGRYGGYDRTAPQVWNAPAIPQPPTFSGSIKAERRAFMLEYLKYLRQINDMQCNGSRAFAMSVSACMNPFSKRRIALLDCNRDHNSITNYEWVAWFKSAGDSFRTKILDVESRVGRMSDEMMRSLA